VVRNQEEGSPNEGNQENDEEAGFLDERQQIPSSNEVQSKHNQVTEDHIFLSFFIR
jgi:hypothetical protein